MAKKKLGTVARLSELDKSLRNRLLRVRSRLLFIVHSAIGAGVAYWIAVEVIKHGQPFFAPMSAVIILGLSGGDRIKRATELTLGCALGVGLGDLLIMQIGTGYWQIFVVVGLALLVASFVSPAPLVSNQMAIGGILIATMFPPGDGGSIDRMIDAFIGGSVGILVIALLSSSPLDAGRHQVANVLGIAASVLEDVAASLKAKDAAKLNNALEALRRSQASVNKLETAASSGKEATTVSPFLWGDRARVRSLYRILAPVDNVIRNARVLARRAVVLTEDNDTVSDQQIHVIEEIADIALRLSDLYEHHKEISEALEIPELVNRLRQLGSEVGEDIAEDRVLSAQVILAQSRSIIVDLLQICGMSRESAVAVLVPTSESPAYPPELWDDED
ncbi:aromatic acid exporter family protein [Corynebacterium glutamicum]|uniref:FUSC family protein n=1 Tax=Corynebacterium glutamicum TaxID=1718 RepID=UPI00241864E4|nr:aromatic acid exporter family protein [Corynebacterium glutamicum]WFP72032.1 aromatic acid exporter family protein [Corynebacterium glutamicum]